MALDLDFDYIQAILVMIRVVSVITIGPVFGPVNYPPQIRLLLAAFMALIIWPTTPAAVVSPDGLLPLAMCVIAEFALGASLGFLIQVCFSVASISGQQIATTGGMAMANLFDPVNNAQQTVVTQLQNILIFLLFFQLDMHHLLLKGLMWSFETIPPGGVGAGTQIGLLFINQMGSIIGTAIQLSLPPVMMVLIVQAGLGFMARMAPQMNVFFSLGHSITQLLTLAILAFCLPLFKTMFTELFENIGFQMMDIIHIFAQ